MAKASAKNKVQTKPVKANRSKPATSKGSMGTQNRNDSIAFEAYLLAEQRGFQGGDPVADWLIAEAKVDQQNQAA
jgi:hypothetical protein